jgi:hypothetical protein
MSQDGQARDSACEVPDPTKLWATLKERVQVQAIKQFKEVSADWLALMWCLDSHRMNGTVPAGTDDIDVLNRQKGNWFAELIALLLQNRTAQHIGARTQVQGFSQSHQIDIAWPDRKQDVLVCVETKVTGAPPSLSRGARPATADWTNRRKELKFAATDLKLYRRQQSTSIEHWDVWRKDSPPKTFFIWGARLDSKRDSIDRMTKEVRSLIETYLDGAALFAWSTRQDGMGYGAIDLKVSERVLELDDVLYRISSEIGRLSGADGKPPAPVAPQRTVTLAEDL